MDLQVISNEEKRQNRKAADGSTKAGRTKYMLTVKAPGGQTANVRVSAKFYSICTGQPIKTPAPPKAKKEKKTKKAESTEA